MSILGNVDKRRQCILVVMLTITLLISGCYQRVGIEGNSRNVDYQIIKIDETFQPESQLTNRMNNHPNQPNIKTAGYRIGVGDVLLINLYIPDVSGERGVIRIIPQPQALPGENEFLVDENGMIALPFTDQIYVTGLTTSEATTKITKNVSKLYRSPRLDISIKEFTSKRAVITGEVKQPRELFLTRTPLTIMMAVEKSGGILPSADLQSAVLKRANGTDELIDLDALLNHGDDRYNKILHSGDTLHLPQNHGNKMFVVGEAATPKSIVLESNTVTLTEAIGAVSGLNPKTADPSAVYILREQDSSSRVKIFHLNASNPTAYVHADKFIIKPRDVLFIGTRNITDWARFAGQLLPGAIAGLAQPAPYILQ